MAGWLHPHHIADLLYWRARANREEPAVVVSAEAADKTLRDRKPKRGKDWRKNPAISVDELRRKLAPAS